MDKSDRIEKDIKVGIKLITKEIYSIDKWRNTAETVRRNIEKYPEPYLRQYAAIRTVFRNGLLRLENAATEFLQSQNIDIRDIIGQERTHGKRSWLMKSWPFVISMINSAAQFAKSISYFGNFFR